MKIGVFGPQGSGKTLLAVLLARMVQSVDPMASIWTNVIGKNDDPYFHTITDLADFPFETDDEKDRSEPHQWRAPKIMLVDEAMFSMSSRGAGSNINELWTRAIAFFRKNNVVLSLYATHRPGMLDNRIREQLDAVIMCRKNKHYFDYLYIDMLTYIQVPLMLPKAQRVFEKANYNTHQMPMPIEVTRLAEHPLFKLIRIEREKIKTGSKNEKNSPTGVGA